MTRSSDRQTTNENQLELDSDRRTRKLDLLSLVDVIARLFPFTRSERQFYPFTSKTKMTILVGFKRWRRNVAILILLGCLCNYSAAAFQAIGGFSRRPLHVHMVPAGTSMRNRLKTPQMERALSFKSASSSTTKLALWGGDEEITGSDRFKACFPYLLPLIDGEIFGRYIYERVPPLGFLDSLFMGPLSDFFMRVPFLTLLVFLALTLGTRGNTEMSRAVRFNAQQAALIDVALVFPELIGSAFEGEDIPRYIVEPCMNFVWYTYMALVLYSIYSNLKGKKPDQIPWISGYADIMVGPF